MCIRDSPRYGTRERALKERDTHRQADTVGQRKDARHERDCRIETETLNEKKERKAKAKKKQPVNSSNRVISIYTLTVAAEQVLSGDLSKEETSAYPQYRT